MLKLGRVTKFKMLFLVLVFVFNFDVFKYLAAILEKGLFKGNFVDGQNNPKYRDVAPLYAYLWQLNLVTTHMVSSHIQGLLSSPMSWKRITKRRPAFLSKHFTSVR